MRLQSCSPDLRDPDRFIDSQSEVLPELADYQLNRKNLNRPDDGNR